MQKKYVVKDILKQHNITAWYQPIVNIESQELLGWEAFSRGQETDKGLATPAMFDSAAEAGILKPFDLMCIHNAATCFEQLQLSNKLFINLSNEMLIASSRLKQQVGKMIAANAIPPNKMVLEIDEKNATENTQDLVEAVRYFHELGFEIAIDHLSGMGNVGENRALHSLWEELNPDFIKLDRGFIENINGSATKQKTVKELVAVARTIGAILIAEGVESKRELQKLYELGIHHVQGYLIQKPELAPLPPRIDHLLEHEIFSQTSQASLACDLVVDKSYIDIHANVEQVFDFFDGNAHLNSVVVTEDFHVKGIIFRRPFLSKYAKKQRREVVCSQSVVTVMTTNFLSVDAHQRIEQVSRLLTSRAQLNAEHDYVIESEGRFLGIGTVIDLLKKVTQLRVQPDHQENLLTMLPGNTPISSCVNELLEKDEAFTVVLLDLSNFKVFNNQYGHHAGDQVLIMFAELLRRRVAKSKNFIGHIGGDDFVMVLPSMDWQPLLSKVFESFQNKIVKFYSEQDIEQGGVKVNQYNGDFVLEPLIHLSAGVLTIHDEYVESFERVLARLICLKPLTKNINELCVVHQYHEQINRYSFLEGVFTKEHFE